MYNKYLQMNVLRYESNVIRFAVSGVTSPIRPKIAWPVYSQLQKQVYVYRALET